VGTIPVVPLERPSLETEWEAYNARSLVSHAGHFVPVRNATVAFRRPATPRAALRVALVSTGGVHLASQPPFDLSSHTGDHTVRWIPGQARAADLRFAHDHYDHTDCDADPDCMFPLARLRELAAEGSVGSVAAWHGGCMGFIPDPARFLGETVPEMAARFLEDGVDAAVFSPG
jgi:D-proline reductase (dithiol) PrdB